MRANFRVNLRRRKPNLFMIETWLQVSCDGCEEQTLFAATSNITRPIFRKELHDFGWRSIAKYDYCPVCVSDNKHLDGKSIYNNESSAQ